MFTAGFFVLLLSFFIVYYRINQLLVWNLNCWPLPYLATHKTRASSQPNIATMKPYRKVGWMIIPMHDLQIIQVHFDCSNSPRMDQIKKFDLKTFDKMLVDEKACWQLQVKTQRHFQSSAANCLDVDNADNENREFSCAKLQFSDTFLKSYRFVNMLFEVFNIKTLLSS